MKKKCAIFGYLDNLAIFLDYNLDKFSEYENKIFISYNVIPNINQKLENKKRPLRNTEFPTKKNLLNNKKIYQTKNFINTLKKYKIRDIFIAEPDMEVRKKIYDKCKNNKIRVNSFVHPSAILGGKNKIGEGTIIYPNCYIGYKTEIRKCVQIQSSVTIEHHSLVDSFTNINPGVSTGGNVKIGKNCELGLSSTIINRINLSDQTTIGAKSLVLKNITKKNTINYGIPSKSYEKKN